MLSMNSPFFPAFARISMALSCRFEWVESLIQFAAKYLDVPFDFPQPDRT
jgi:hypothetical protein